MAQLLYMNLHGQNHYLFKKKMKSLKDMELHH